MTQPTNDTPDTLRTEPTERIPAEVFHPSIFIQEEMEARGWNRGVLAERMGPDAARNLVVLELYLDMGPTKPGMILGAKTAEALSRAFGTSPEFFLNLHMSWKKGQSHDQ